MAVKPWVKDLVARCFGDEPQNPIGKTFYAINSGRRVLVTSGQYWGEYGVSNFWYGSYLSADGAQEGEWHGYGNELVDLAPPWVVEYYQIFEDDQRYRRVNADGTREPVDGPIEGLPLFRA